MARVTVKHLLPYDALVDPEFLGGGGLSGIQEGGAYRGQRITRLDRTREGDMLLEVETRMVDAMARLHYWHYGPGKPSVHDAYAGNTITWSSAPGENALAALASLSRDTPMQHWRGWQHAYDEATAAPLPRGDGTVPESVRISVMRNRAGFNIALPEGMEIPDLTPHHVESYSSMTDWSIRTCADILLTGAQIVILAQTDHLHIGDDGRVMLDDVPVTGVRRYPADGTKWEITTMAHRSDLSATVSGISQDHARHVHSAMAVERLRKVALSWAPVENVPAVPRRKPRRVGNPNMP